jgi:hypothetical protein
MDQFLAAVSGTDSVSRLRALVRQSGGGAEQTLRTLLPSPEAATVARTLGYQGSWQPDPATARARSLLEADRFLDASRQLGTCPPSPEVRALQALAYFKLAGLDARSGVTSALAAAEGHPLTPLVLALMYAAEAGKEVEGPAKTTLQARAFGQALAYAFHPAAGALPASWREEAESLLREYGPSLRSKGTTVAAPRRAAEAPLGDGGAAADSPALQELSRLTGLAEVKRAFGALRDRVLLDTERGVDVRKQQYSAIFSGNPGTGRA